MTSAYEALRLDVHTGVPGRGRGWVLLVRRGMRSWCEVCHQHDQQVSEAEKNKSSVSMVSASLERTVVQVLAGMVLKLQEGVSSHV